MDQTWSNVSPPSLMNNFHRVDWEDWLKQFVNKTIQASQTSLCEL